MNENSINVDEMWRSYAREKTLELKNELIIHYLYIVKSVVFRMLPTFEGYSNYDDMMSCGILGLMDAIGKYDLSREVKFDYYAQMRIKGEIIDYLRKQDWAPSSLRRKIKDVSNAYQELESSLCRTPTNQEVAHHLKLGVEEVHHVVEKSRIFNSVHIEDLLSDDLTVETLIHDDGESPEEHLENMEMKDYLGQLIDDLAENERLVVTLYYYEEMTFKEIASVLKVSESRISQIHSKVIIKLKNKMHYAFNQ